MILDRLLPIALLMSCLAASAAAQTANDGFLRRNGSTYILRHGQLRPLTREAHLPNGRTVTPDGFVLQADGRRVALVEGQGCDLRGNPVGSQQGAGGTWALAARPAVRPGEVQRAEQVLRLSPGQRKKWYRFFKKRGRKHDD
ncbi:hypothetical protein GCM10027048_34600 [Hymenobacter coalescens]